MGAAVVPLPPVQLRPVAAAGSAAAEHVASRLRRRAPRLGSSAVRAGHLARRFVGSLWPLGPRRGSELWVGETLMPGELALWRQMSPPDRRHAVRVARGRQASHRGPAEPPGLAAGLLH